MIGSGTSCTLLWVPCLPPGGERERLNSGADSRDVGLHPASRRRFDEHDTHTLEYSVLGHPYLG